MAFKEKLKEFYKKYVFGEDSKHRNLLEQSFDEDYYLKHYPEVIKSKYGPLDHFIHKGWKMGYNPSQEFNTIFYLKKYDDVRDAGINPFYHYLKFGKLEGRIPNLDYGPPPITDEFSVIQKPDSSANNLKADSNKEEVRVAVVEKKIKSKYKVDREVAKVVKTEFNAKFYIDNYLKGNYSKKDALIHYLDIGWKMGNNPNPNFSTEHYLRVNPDIRHAKINPFYHYLKYGQHEGRSPIGLMHRSNLKLFKPKVTAIVPNYNHEKFLIERIDSILAQTYQNIEILLLDDCSSDNSVDIINSYCEEYPNRIKKSINTENSGNVFKQWKKGIESADGDLIWICESDDLVEPNFVERLIPYFIDLAVMISFGKIQFINQDGAFMEGLDGYRNGAEPGIWDKVRIRSAKRWFNGCFGIRNVIPNVGGCLIRKQFISEETWKQAQSYKILGDWYLYSVLSNGGKIAYNPDAVSYFRQHGKNTSVKSFQSMYYYEEHNRLITHLVKRWGIESGIIKQFYKYIRFQYVHHHGEETINKFNEVISLSDLMKLKREKAHIIIGFLGFHVGGGEIFPIHLANELANIGYIVSMVALNRSDEKREVRELLDKRIAVYDTELINVMGVNSFFKYIGANLINTHYVGLEFQLLLNKEERFELPYIVTLHGSYEVTNLTKGNLYDLLCNVSHWVYTANKNLSRIQDIPLSNTNVTKLPNAMAITNEAFESGRASIGLSKDDVVFGLVARPIESKGWEEAILATRNLSKDFPEIHLFLVGEGEYQKKLEEKYGEHDHIHFLGFQSNINGFYRDVDVCLLPTRFKGESYPLVLIQSLQVGTPIVSVNIGEINSILYVEDRKAGISIEYTEDDNDFIKSLEVAMKEILNEDLRKEFTENALVFGEKYSINRIANSYADIFNTYL